MVSCVVYENRDWVMRLSSSVRLEDRRGEGLVTKTDLKETAGCAVARVDGLRADDRVVAGLPRKRPSPTLEIFRAIYKFLFCKNGKTTSFCYPLGFFVQAAGTAGTRGLNVPGKFGKGP